VLTADVRFEGWSPTDWSRFLSLFRVVPPDGALAANDGEPRGGLVLVYEGGRIRKALHTIGGRVDPHAVAWPRPLDEVAKEQRATWVWAFHCGALEELMERFGARVRRGDDALTQSLVLFGAFRELIDEGAIDSWPRKLRGVPVPTRTVVDRVIDSLVSASRAAVVALYDQGELWTALVLRRSAESPARFDVIAGPAQLRREMGLLSGEFRRDYRHLVDAVEAMYAPVSVGLHAEVETFRGLITSAQAGDWAKAVALRDVVVSPVPLGLAIPLGVDATRGAVELAGRLARQIDPIGIVQPLLRAVGNVLPALPPAGGGPRFDPLDMLRKLLNR